MCEDCEYSQYWEKQISDLENRIQESLIEIKSFFREEYQSIHKETMGNLKDGMTSSISEMNQSIETFKIELESNAKSDLRATDAEIDEVKEDIEELKKAQLCLGKRIHELCKKERVANVPKTNKSKT